MQFYRPFWQVPNIGGRIMIRTEGNPLDMTPALKAAVYAADPEVPVESIQTLEALRAGRLASPALNAALVSIFAAVALLITVAGVAAVIATTVSQRGREFGVRMALGASRSSVLTMVLRQGLTLVVSGLVVGALGAIGISRGVASYLYGTRPTEPLVYAAVALVFVVAAVIACLWPARRATSIDPLVALKAD